MNKLIQVFRKIYKNKQYKPVVMILGCLSLFFVFLKYKSKEGANKYSTYVQAVKADFEKKQVYQALEAEARLQVEKKNAFFGKSVPAAQLKKEIKAIAQVKYQAQLDEEIKKRTQKDGVTQIAFEDVFAEMISNKLFFVFSLVVSFPMYLLLLIFQNPYAKFVCERLVMMLFVIFGVTVMVFTILYFSPMDPARNILGITATDEQIATFNRTYNLDKSYFERLILTFKQVITFDLGNTYVGNMDVVTEILNKFPTTLMLAFSALSVAVVIAIPAGIISAIKQYSTFDYAFMFFALIGLSIPNFWFALMLILQFSINMQWLPATFVVGDWTSMIMPAVVLGTSLSASIARMTRSSMLEVKHSDYILTAKAKGLSVYNVTMKHILGNALIPIVTVVGLQFGGMLGGSAVVEKVFNISGLGSFIVDRQFIPDIPVVLGGVI